MQNQASRREIAMCDSVALQTSEFAENLYMIQVSFFFSHSLYTLSTKQCSLLKMLISNFHSPTCGQCSSHISGLLYIFGIDMFIFCFKSVNLFYFCFSAKNCFPQSLMCSSPNCLKGTLDAQKNWINFEMQEFH